MGRGSSSWPAPALITVNWHLLDLWIDLTVHQITSTASCDMVTVIWQMRLASIILFIIAAAFIDPGLSTYRITSDDDLAKAAPPFDVQDRDLVTSFSAFAEGKRLLLLRATRAWRGKSIRYGPNVPCGPPDPCC